MRHKKSPSGSFNASSLSSSSVSSSPPPPPPPPVLSNVSSSLSSSFLSMYSPSPMPLSSPPKTLYHNAHIIEDCTIPSSSSSSSSSFPVPYCKVSSSKKKSSCSKWVPNFFKLGKLSNMEAEDGFLLQQRALDGLLEDGKLADKPKKELRFAAKIAVAMDADGFIGVKNSVCADDALIEVKHNIDTHYCVPSPSTLPRKERKERKERPPLKQARPPRRRWRRWKLFRRIRRTRVLCACLFQKVRKAFTSSSKRTLEAHDKFIK